MSSGAERARTADSADTAVHYRIEVADAQAHLFRVTLTIDEPEAPQRVALPVWIPGSYMVREFSKHLQNFKARQGGRAVPVEQTGKAAWQVDCRAGRPLVLSWQVYAYDNSVRCAFLDANRGFFNATGLCLRVEGQEGRPHALELPPPRHASDWRVATALEPVSVARDGFGDYLAADYDELADCPVEMGTFWQGEFTAAGVPHRLVVAGAAPTFDGERLLADCRRICETQIRFWHRNGKPPFKQYVFLLNVVDEGYGGLEHRNSTALIASRRDLPRVGQFDQGRQGEGYTTLLGLISHEYFHTWNVKRLRPAEFARYDYERENYTRLLWFFEGFTSYYDDLLLRRSGLVDDSTFVRLLGKAINQVQQTPGRLVQSVAQASFDAWIKYYRQDENTPNATVSYYSKGSLVALCLDLALRTEGHTTLDDVMRAVYQRCKGGPMHEDDLLAVLEQLGRRDFAGDLHDWVHSTAELPLEILLMQHGIAVLDEPSQPAQRLGLRVAEADGRVTVKAVLRGGAAEAAGFCAGDEWLAVELGSGTWRLRKLDDLALYAGTQRRLTAWVARDQRVLQLPLLLPEDARTWRLAIRDERAVRAWLG